MTDQLTLEHIRHCIKQVKVTQLPLNFLNKLTENDTQIINNKPIFSPFSLIATLLLGGRTNYPVIHFSKIFSCCQFNSQVTSYFTYLIFLQNNSFAVNRERVYWIFKRHRQCFKDNGMWSTLPQKFLSILLGVTFEGRNLLPHGLEEAVGADLGPPSRPQHAEESIQLLAQGSI